MKLAIVSTTIRGEKGYLAFDRLAAKSPFSEVCFIISGDLNSKPFDDSQFECDIEYLDAEAQEKYRCSKSIGWRKIMRRNIALLRAIEKKPDYILVIDDDNIPDEDYFETWYTVLNTPVEQICVNYGFGKAPWHNYLRTSDAPIEVYPRGYPVPFRRLDDTRIEKLTKPISNSQIGVYQGISLGDPDIDAMTRIVYPAAIHSVKEKNYCLQNVWSPYNTQNTMFAKALFPLIFVWPYCGRYDDIYSSFVWQKFLFNNDMYAFVGDAINIQNRGERGFFKDLKDEMEGYFYSHIVWEEINQITATDPIDFIHALIDSEQEIVARQKEFMVAFLEDLERSM